MNQPLLDSDGENRAVRAFLMLYGTPGLTVDSMRLHMQRSGYAFWPEWVSHASGHLTKGGAQHWLRMLFALETQGGGK